MVENKYCKLSEEINMAKSQSGGAYHWCSDICGCVVTVSILKCACGFAMDRERMMLRSNWVRNCGLCDILHPFDVPRWLGDSELLLYGHCMNGKIIKWVPMMWGFHILWGGSMSFREALMKWSRPCYLYKDYLLIPHKSYHGSIRFVMLWLQNVILGSCCIFGERHNESCHYFLAHRLVVYQRGRFRFSMVCWRLDWSIMEIIQNGYGNYWVSR